MKRLLSLIIVLCGLVDVVPAQSKYHIAVNVGYRYQRELSSERYFKGDVTFGYRVFPRIRLDLTAGYATGIHPQAKYADVYQIEVLATPLVWLPEERVIADISMGVGFQRSVKQKAQGFGNKVYIPVKAYLGYYVTEKLGFALKADLSIFGSEFNRYDGVGISVLYSF
jgi:hypothetical protein